MHPLLPLVLLPVLIAVATVPGWLLAQANEDAERIRGWGRSAVLWCCRCAPGVRKIAALGAEAEMLRHLDERQEQLAAANARHGRRAGRGQAATDGLLAIGVLVTVLVAGDQVVVLEHGEVTAVGTYDELLAVPDGPMPRLLDHPNG